VPLEPSLRASQSVVLNIDQIWEVPSKKVKKMPKILKILI
jgi:hypothetical protein